MMPLDLLDEAVTGTKPEWILLVLLLPFVGRAAARTWGPAGAAAAQRALLVLLLDLAVGLALALPTHAWAFALAALPVAGAAFSRETATLRGHPLAWPGALLLALPAVTLNHLGPHAWAPLWLIGSFAFLLARGTLEPAWSRLQPHLARLRGVARDDAADRTETTLK